VLPARNDYNGLVRHPYRLAAPRAPDLPDPLARLHPPSIVVNQALASLTVTGSLRRYGWGNVLALTAISLVWLIAAMFAGLGAAATFG
jgi:hypothetical protein